MEYSYRVWTATAGEAEDYRVGEDVFVRLGQDKSTGRAVVVREQIADSQHPFHGRIQVKFYDNGSTYHVRPARMRKVYERSVVICDKTREYRRLARNQVAVEDFCVDIGCSWGKATSILAEGCRKVIGIDISEEAVAASRINYPSIQFLQLNCLAQEEELVHVAAGATVVFVDIGGNRDLQSVMKMVHLVKKAICPKKIVVKSESLFEQALKTLQVLPNAVHLTEDWFQEVYDTSLAKATTS